MGWLKRQFYHGVLLLLIGMVCWYGAAGVWAFHNRQWNGDRVSWRNPDSRMDFGDIKELRRQIALDGGGSVTGWGQSLSEEIKAEATADATRVDVLWLDGGAPLLWDLPLVMGQFPGQTDTIGCAIDRETALKLFGTLDIIGKEVRIAGESMTIRGIFTLPEGVSAIPSDPGRGLAFCPAALAKESVRITALEFIAQNSSGMTAKEQVEDWMNAAGLNAGGSLDDHRDTQKLLALFTALPGYLLMAMALMELYAAFAALTKAARSKWAALKNGRLVHGRQLGRVAAAWCALTFVLAAASVCVAGLPAYGNPIPASLLPTRWSDFGFLTEKAEQILQQQVQERLFPALRPDLMERGLVTAGILLSLASLLLIWLSRRALKRGYEQVGIAPASACVGVLIMAAPLSLWLVERVGWIPELLPGMAHLPVVFYAVFCALRTLQQSEKAHAWLFSTKAGGMNM